MNASELYQAGNLNEAITAALAAVKQKPTDLSQRFTLAELLCFAGDFQRADKQLEAITQQSTDAAMRVSVFRHLIRAEEARHAFYRDGALPEFVAEVSPALRLHLDASIALREGDTAQAADLLAQAEEQRPQVAGTVDGKPFDDWRDVSDLTAGFLEVLTTTGKYYWVPTERVESLEFHPPERMSDLIWRRTAIQVTDGPEGEVYIPAIYAQTAEQDDAQLSLGRGTDWLGSEGEPIRGVGLRIFLMGEDDKTIMQINQITTQPNSA